MYKRKHTKVKESRQNKDNRLLCSTLSNKKSDRKQSILLIKEFKFNYNIK
jgi:hypothetical protein